jgi:5-formyltetrahydrofolate cyclo-ligase
MPPPDRSRPTVKVSPAAAEKALLRARFAAARLAMSDEAYLAASGAICDRLAALPPVEQADTIHVYWPLVARREVDTRPLIARLAEKGRRIVMPVVAPTDSDPRAMRHVAFAGEEELRASRWGLLEPVGEDVGLGEIDVVIVPAFGAGRNGHRIGHGRGYYDAFLARCPAIAVAAVFANCLVDYVPAEAHDIPVAAIVTERESVVISE